jgi:hypothetical protein
MVLLASSFFLIPRSGRVLLVLYSRSVQAVHQSDQAVGAVVVSCHFASFVPPGPVSRVPGAQ